MGPTLFVGWLRFLLMVAIEFQLLFGFRVALGENFDCDHVFHRKINIDSSGTHQKMLIDGPEQRTRVENRGAMGMMRK